MAAEIYKREHWSDHKDKNPHLYSSVYWMVWEAMRQVEEKGSRVISARMSRGYTVRVMTERGEIFIKVLD